MYNNYIIIQVWFYFRRGGWLGARVGRGNQTVQLLDSPDSHFLCSQIPASCWEHDSSEASSRETAAAGGTPTAEIQRGVEHGSGGAEPSYRRGKATSLVLNACIIQNKHYMQISHGPWHKVILKEDKTYAFLLNASGLVQKEKFATECLILLT